MEMGSFYPHLQANFSYTGRIETIQRRIYAVEGSEFTDAHVNNNI